MIYKTMEDAHNDHLSSSSLSTHPWRA